MSATYKLQLKQYQKRLGLTDKELNKLDRKYNDINLIKKLQLLSKVSTVKTGFWGTFLVSNEPATGSSARHMFAYLAYNDVPLTSSQQINSTDAYTFNVAQADRLPSPSSILQIKITCQSGTSLVDVNPYAGFQITSASTNPYDQENTVNMLVNENNYDNGSCSATFLLTYEP